MSLPQTNARLRRVAPRAGLEDYGSEAAAGPEKFAGVVGVYFREKRRRRAGSDFSLIVERSLIVPTSRPAIDFAEGDVVELERKVAGRWESIEATIADVEVRETPGVAGSALLTFAPS